MEQTAGDWADARDGAPIRFPVLIGLGSPEMVASGIVLVMVASARSVLFGNANRSSLPVQFSEKLFFIKPTAGSQQL